LPVVDAHRLHLPSDEHCYLSVAATRWRPLKSGPQPVQGQLTVTNRKIRFSALKHGGEVALGKVLRACGSTAAPSLWKRRQDRSAAITR
jgi:hypothetical protein